MLCVGAYMIIRWVYLGICWQPTLNALLVRVTNFPSYPLSSSFLSVPVSMPVFLSRVYSSCTGHFNVVAPEPKETRTTAVLTHPSCPSTRHCTFPSFQKVLRCASSCISTMSSKVTDHYPLLGTAAYLSTSLRSMRYSFLHWFLKCPNRC